MAVRDERWPKFADKTAVAGCDVFVYRDSAIIQPPSRAPWDEGSDICLGAAELRELAAELLWAADRLDGRVSPHCP